MPQKTWSVGEEVLAADFNTYVQQQVVGTFANKAALDAYAGPNGSVAVTTDGADPWIRRAGVWAGLPRGTIMKATKPSNQAGFSTAETPIGGLSVTAPAVTTGRLYRATFQVRAFPDSSRAVNDYIVIYIRNGATTAGTILDQFTLGASAAINNAWHFSATTTTFAPAAGSTVAAFFLAPTANWTIQTASWLELSDVGG